MDIAQECSSNQPVRVPTKIDQTFVPSQQCEWEPSASSSKAPYGRCAPKFGPSGPTVTKGNFSSAKLDPKDKALSDWYNSFEPKEKSKKQSVLNSKSKLDSIDYNRWVAGTADIKNIVANDPTLLYKGLTYVPLKR